LIHASAEPAAVQAVQAQLGAARADRGPNVSLDASVGRSPVSVETDATRQISSSAQVTVTIFEPLPVAQSVPAVRTVPKSWAHGYANAVRRAEYRRAELVNRLLTMTAFVVVYAPLWVTVLGAFGFLLWYYRTVLSRAVRRFVAMVVTLRSRTATRTGVGETGN